MAPQAGKATPNIGSSAEAKDFSCAMAPVIVEALRESSREDSRALSEIFSPIIGPAIRKAMSNFFDALVEKLDQVVDKSFSLKGIRWRIEAIRTGRPFSEVAILRSLSYSVERVLLIHRQTGLLLASVFRAANEAPDEKAKVPQVLAATLTAIQDFVRDSFSSVEPPSERDPHIETMKIGDDNIWVEEGTLCYLVCFLRGHPPKAIRPVFSDALRIIERDFSHQCLAFSGDTSGFRDTEPSLRKCLLKNEGESSRRASQLRGWLVLFGLLVMLFAPVGITVARHAIRAARWERYVDRLEQTPGIVVSQIGNEKGALVVRGLRDPYAQSPDSLREWAALKKMKVENRFEPYFSLSPEVFSRRFRAVTGAPPGVRIASRGDAWILSGHAPFVWIARHQGELSAFFGALPWSEKNLTDDELLDLKSGQRRLAGIPVDFSTGSAALTKADYAKLKELAAIVASLVPDAKKSGRKMTIWVDGDSDETGSWAANRFLERQRAENVRHALIGMKVPRDLLKARPYEVGARRKAAELDLEISDRGDAWGGR